jgi:hypothetical protein
MNENKRLVWFIEERGEGNTRGGGYAIVYLSFFVNTANPGQLRSFKIERGGRRP